MLNDISAVVSSPNDMVNRKKQIYELTRDVLSSELELRIEEFYDDEKNRHIRVHINDDQWSSIVQVTCLASCNV